MKAIKNLEKRPKLKCKFFHRLRSIDSDEELNSSAMELDQSFQRLLIDKREMTNKENNPPPNLTDTKVVPEKPLRKDLLRERLIEKMHMDSLNSSFSMYHAADSSSHKLQNTSKGNEEYAVINRFMAGCDAEYESMVNEAAETDGPFPEELAIRGDFDKYVANKPLSSSLSTSLASPLSSVVKVERFPHVLRELNMEKTLNANTDDTLEEIEYVRTETGLNYVPKKKEQRISESESNDNLQVILIESSPENSFVTTQNISHFASVESTEYSFQTAKADFTGKSKASDLSYATDINDTNSTEIKPEELESSVVVSKSDGLTHSTVGTLRYSVSDNLEPSHQCRALENVSTVTEDELSSVNTLSEMPEFNNTLERIEYMMEQGQKMLRRADVNPNSPAPSNRISTTFGLEKKATPSKKIFFKPSSAVKTDLFKRPEQRIRSPSSQLSATSKIPKSKFTAPISSTSKPQFRHIASPIAAYIKNTPEIPLIQTVKPVKDLFDSSYYSKMVRLQDESTVSVENFSVKSSLPRKICNAAPQRQVLPFNAKYLKNLSEKRLFLFFRRLWTSVT